MAGILLDEFGKIHDIGMLGMGYGSFLRRGDHKLHKSSAPMNDFYWFKYASTDDKAASMHDFKYLDYEDQAMMRIKKFNKDR